MKASCAITHAGFSNSRDTIDEDGMKHRVEAYLTDINKRIHDIDALRDRIDDIESQMSGLKGVQYKADPPNPNVNKDAALECMAMLEETHVRLYEEVALHFEEINHAWELCRPLVSENRYMLWLHYVQGMKWNKVARALNLTEATLFRKSKEGIEELYRAMPETARRDDEHKAEL